MLQTEPTVRSLWNTCAGCVICTTGRAWLLKKIVSSLAKQKNTCEYQYTKHERPCFTTFQKKSCENTNNNNTQWISFDELLAVWNGYKALFWLFDIFSLETKTYVWIDT